MKQRGAPIEIGGIGMELVRKSVRNIRVSVGPPDGRVRVSAPPFVSDAAVRRFVVSHLDWIEKQRAKWADRALRFREENGDDSRLFFLGAAYPLVVREKAGRARVDFSPSAGFGLFLPPGAGKEKRDALLESWYRERLREALAPLVESWSAAMGVEPREWSVRRMKTRWGSCNIVARRLWFSLELAKKPRACLEYLVVHELAHLIEGGHGDRFKALMDRFLPDWKSRRKALHGAPAN